MWLTYSYLVSWVLGGLALISMLALRTHARPYATAVGAMAYGATGYLCIGFGLQPHFLFSLGGALAGATLGYALQVLGREPPGLPLDVPR